MSFSERMGLITKKALQLNDIDPELKNALWNAFYIEICQAITDGKALYGFANEQFLTYAAELWSEFFKERVETTPHKNSDAVHGIRLRLEKLPWNKIYDFVQFNIDYLRTNPHLKIKNKYIKECNRVLIRESSAFRIFEDMVVPISNEEELQSIEQAINDSSFRGVEIHLRASIDKLSSKTNPDYRNSIKESISAVETLCREITGENTLGKAINKLEHYGLKINKQFKDALEKLYAYTNNSETGIRHALLESAQPPDFDEAKFMLVACSAFINYLISKKSLLQPERSGKIDG